MALRACKLGQTLASSIKRPSSGVAIANVEQIFVRRFTCPSRASSRAFKHAAALHDSFDSRKSHSLAPFVKRLNTRRLLSTPASDSENSADGTRDARAIQIAAENEDEGIAQLTDFLSFEPTSEMLFTKSCLVNGGVYVTRYKRNSQDGGMAVSVTINNPKKSNSLTSEIIFDLTAVFKAISKSSKVRVVTLRGQFNGKKSSFSSGADLNEMSQMSTAQEAETFIRKVLSLCNSVRDCPAVVIAFIDGHCWGAGLELAASCDLRYATTRSTFAMPEVKVGIPSVVQARLLADIVGWAKMRNMLLLGETIDSKEALFIGLIDKAPGMKGKDAGYDQLRSLVNEVVHGLIYTTGMEAVRAQKRLIQQWENMSVDEGIEASVKPFADMWASDESEPKRRMSQRLESMKRRKEVSTARAAAAEAQRAAAKAAQTEAETPQE